MSNLRSKKKGISFSGSRHGDEWFTKLAPGPGAYNLVSAHEKTQFRRTQSAHLVGRPPVVDFEEMTKPGPAPAPTHSRQQQQASGKPRQQQQHAGPPPTVASNNGSGPIYHGPTYNHDAFQKRIGRPGMPLPAPLLGTAPLPTNSTKQRTVYTLLTFFAFVLLIDCCCFLA
jgi:hypothetical protein